MLKKIGTIRFIQAGVVLLFEVYGECTYATDFPRALCFHGKIKTASGDTNALTSIRIFTTKL
ncbi:hypothetical protein CA265_07625 [Sphingobacteriaceae bacterium GW460-11-11-14-LB5]|nr:hypothetical protein CA265_07625 [Sphingobacteriaceae bacterium GW460-11-11-14-LB5]